MANRVTLSFPPAEDVLGRVLTTAIGERYANLLTQAMMVIPRYVDGIDKTVEPFLEELIGALQKLGENWKENTIPDEHLLGKVIGMLEKFEAHADKTVLLYPQIVQAKPSTSSQNELQDIQSKRSEAELKTRSLSIDKIIPLLTVLKGCQQPSLDNGASSVEILKSIGELKIALEEIVDEQRSLLAKVVHAVKTLALEAIQDGIKRFKSSPHEHLSVNHHSLMRLLRIIGKYQGNEIYLPSDKKKEIENALQTLESTCPQFKGLYELIRESTSNLVEVHQRITTFIKDRIYSDLDKNGKKGFCQQVARFAKIRQVELIEIATSEMKKKKDGALREVQEELDKSYKNIGNDGAVSGYVKNFAGGTTAVQQKESALKDATERMNKVEEGLKSNLESQILEINNHFFWASIDTDKAWGQKFLSGELKNVPKEFFTQVSRDEIVWKAAAYYLQKMEWKALDLEGVKEPKQLLKAFEKALAYIDRLEAIESGLEESESKESVKKSLDYILGWMDYAKTQMIERGQNSWEKAKIEGAFNDALKGIRKGEVRSSIKAIQDFIRRSSYWNLLWKETPSPLMTLAPSFDGFNKTLPPLKPPKSAEEVHTILGHAKDVKWDVQYLAEANKIVKEQVLESALGLICFEYVAYFLSLNGDKAAYYKKVVDTVDKIVALKVRDSASLKPLLDNFLGAESKREKQFLDALNSSSRKQLFLELLNILIIEKGSRTSSSSWVAWGSFSLFYDLVELFIRPFSEQLFGEVDKLLENASGTLSQKHLVPIKGVTKALATYQLAMEEWAKFPITGSKDDIVGILNKSKSYEGLLPAQITRKFGYSIVDQIKFPDYTKGIYKAMQKVKEFAWTPRTQYKLLNFPIFAGQWMVAGPAYMTLFTVSYVVRLVTYISNYFLQLTGKIYLWKTDLASLLLDQSLNSVSVDVESAPILDTLLLEQLQDLAKELEKGAPPEHAETAVGDETSKKVISEALQYLFEVIEKEPLESSQSYNERPRDGIVVVVKKLAYEELKKLLSTVLVSTSKSLLQKEQVSALLFELFKISKESLQGGKGVVLTQEQKEALAARLGHVPTDEEITQEGKRISVDNLKKIPEVLSRIRTLAINPAIDEGINRITQTPSQILLDYISWIQTRLFSSTAFSANRGVKLNMLQFLKEKLSAYNQSGNDKIEILREIHFKYGQFIQEMSEFQKSLDGNPSPNSPELNEFIRADLSPRIKGLTDALKNFIHDPIDTHFGACNDALLALDDLQLCALTELAKIEESEKSLVMGLQAGMQGIVQTNLVDVASAFKDGAKNILHTVVQLEIDNKVDQLRKINKNKVLVKHLILWQMRLYLNPELAFKV